MKSNMRISEASTRGLGHALGRVAGLAVLSVLCLSAWLTSALAGNPVDELNYRYGCSVGGKGAAVQYQSRGEPWTVGVELVANNNPAIIVNERAIYEQPFEVAAFEYFSACEQLLEIASAGNRVQLTTNAAVARRMLFRTDCKAVGRMQREGLMRGSRAATTLLNAFYYQRAKQTYMRVLFSERADNIRKTCPP